MFGIENIFDYYIVQSHVLHSWGGKEAMREGRDLGFDSRAAQIFCSITDTLVRIVATGFVVFL